MLASVIDPRGVRDIAPLVTDADGMLTVVPAAVYQETTREERAVFGVRHAAYVLPTIELVQYLKQVIAGRPTIEIGSGNGVLANALGIPATDNRQQEDRSVRDYYAALQQPTISYGPAVEKVDAAAAVAKYRPSVVVASWVTHRYDPSRHQAGGNEDGVLEESVIEQCDAYVFIGNERVHAGKSIWSIPHEKVTPPWLYSRAWNESQDFIAVWGR